MPLEAVCEGARLCSSKGTLSPGQACEAMWSYDSRKLSSGYLLRAFSGMYQHQALGLQLELLGRATRHLMSATWLIESAHRAWHTVQGRRTARDT